MEDWEKPEEAIQREVLEEAWYKADSIELFMVDGAGYRLECNRFTFFLRGCEKIKEPQLDAWEKIETIEMSLNDFIESIMDGKIQARDLQREFLIEYRKDPSLSGLKKKILGL